MPLQFPIDKKGSFHLNEKVEGWKLSLLFTFRGKTKGDEGLNGKVKQMQFNSTQDYFFTMKCISIQIKVKAFMHCGVV